MNEMITVDDLSLELQRSARRKTLELIVDRGGELRVIAPASARQAAIEHFVREKRFWIYTKLTEKEALQRPVSTKQFVSGEGFPYLGRSYRLLLVDDQDQPLKLMAGRFRLLRREAKQGRRHFIAWYTAHAGPWINRRAEAWAPRLAVTLAGVEIRDLGFRWGSCSKDGTLNFHWATILLPTPIIEYVIVHEMVHLHEHNHSPAFWRRLQRAMPDYESRKQWLAAHGGGALPL